MTLPEGWEAAQAARCGCRGSDDFCECQNHYNPAKYGLQETEACGVCGLLASSLMHRFCTRPDCPIPAHIATNPTAQEPGPGRIEAPSPSPHSAGGSES